MRQGPPKEAGDTGPCSAGIPFLVLHAEKPGQLMMERTKYAENVDLKNHLS